MVREGRWSELIREIPVKKGDFIQIDPGTVHAIKGGITLLETQQNSDITYRVYDYDRLSNGKPRELHIKQSLDVITVPAKPAEESVLRIGKKAVNQMIPLISCSYYKVFVLEVENEAVVRNGEPFLIMSVTEGSGTVNGKPIKKGDHFIVPSGFGELTFKGTLELITSTINSR